MHGTDDVAEMESYDTDGPCSAMLSKQSYVTPRGVTEGRIDVYNYGPGFSKVWFSGIVDAINIATTTPIDDETTQVRFNFIVRKFDDEKLDVDRRRRVRRRDQQAGAGRPADLGAQGVPAGRPRSPTPTARSSSSASGTASSTPSPTTWRADARLSAQSWPPGRGLRRVGTRSRSAYSVGLLERVPPILAPGA